MASPDATDHVPETPEGRCFSGQPTCCPDDGYGLLLLDGVAHLVTTG